MFLHTMLDWHQKVPYFFLFCSLYKHILHYSMFLFHRKEQWSILFHKLFCGAIKMAYFIRYFESVVDSLVINFQSCHFQIKYSCMLFDWVKHRFHSFIFSKCHSLLFALYMINNIYVLYITSFTSGGSIFSSSHDFQRWRTLCLFTSST